MAILFNSKLHRFIDSITGRIVSKDPFRRILAKGESQSFRSEQQARDWFRKEAGKVKKSTAVKQINTPLKTGKLNDDLKAQVTGNILPGRMYMFYYDPKYKNDDRVLPYYDHHPLIFPIEYKDNGFLGINFHYLPRRYRAVLMDALYNSQVFTDEKTNKKMLAISYGILKGASKFRYFKPTVKHYLYSHVKSMFLEIPYEQWDIALFLPTEQFMKESMAKAWSDSVKKIGI